MDYIPILIFIIIAVKIANAAGKKVEQSGGSASNIQKRSAAEIREYLQNMRAGNQNMLTQAQQQRVTQQQRVAQQATNVPGKQEVRVPRQDVVVRQPAEQRVIERKIVVKDDGNHIVLITGVGKVYPIIRSHTILNKLQPVIKKNPVVMMYPGRYDLNNSMCLRLFDRLGDDNYYRAFPLEERMTRR